MTIGIYFCLDPQDTNHSKNNVIVPFLISPIQRKILSFHFSLFESNKNKRIHHYTRVTLLSFRPDNLTTRNSLIRILPTTVRDPSILSYAAAKDWSTDNEWRRSVYKGLRQVQKKKKVSSTPKSQPSPRCKRQHYYIRTPFLNGPP